MQHGEPRPLAVTTVVCAHQSGSTSPPPKCSCVQPRWHYHASSCCSPRPPRNHGTMDFNCTNVPLGVKFASPVGALICGNKMHKTPPPLKAAPAITFGASKQASGCPKWGAYFGRSWQRICAANKALGGAGVCVHCPCLVYGGARCARLMLRGLRPLRPAAAPPLTIRSRHPGPNRSRRAKVFMV